jgi:hypothetical protein
MPDNPLGEGWQELGFYASLERVHVAWVRETPDGIELVLPHRGKAESLDFMTDDEFEIFMDGYADELNALSRRRLLGEST